MFRTRYGINVSSDVRDHLIYHFDEQGRENMSDLLPARVLAWPYNGGKRARNFCDGIRGGCEWCYWFSFALVLGSWG